MSSEAEDGGAAGAPGAENGDSSLKDPFLQAVAEALLPPSLELPDRVGSEGKFELREELGAGAMGRVFRARDLKLRRDVAIKFVLPVGGLSSGEMKALFRREARAVARLSHENIVRIFELDDSHDPPFIVMEHLEGRTLHDTLAQGRLSDAQVLDVMRQVSRGLSHAHRSGVFHRDLKPRNVFMCDGGTVKILDFGLAHLEQASTMRATWSSEASAPELPKAGTAAFMAPEQWRGEEIDARTDLWSAGVLLFRLLAGQLPYPTTEPGLLREQITSADAPPRVLDLRPDLPPGFGQVMARAMSKERRERYPNAEAFAADLEWLSRLLPTPGTRPGPPAPPRPSRSFWRERQLQNGLIHRVDENAEQVWKRMLLVFVQDASRAWGQVPEWLASRLGVDVNVLLFHPPLGSGEAMARAVTELGTALETRLSGVRHIVFFTHGDGLQLVRGLLARDAAAASGPGGAEEASRQARTFFRTRLLLHVSGALATAGGIAPEGSEDAGEAPEVARHEVEAELDGLLRGFGPPTAPRPVYRELTVSLPREPVLATDPEDALILDCAAQLTAPGLMVAWEALSQTFAMDCAARIETLVEPAPTSGHEPEEYVAPTVKGAWAGSQREVCEKLLELCRGKRLAPLRAVVTGDAGVGKSSALRRLTRTLTLEYLASPDTGTPQPIHLPLAFVTMSSPHFQALGTAGPRDRGKALHDALLGWWCEWFDRVTFPGAVRPDWVMERLRTKPIVFILDGVDELLTNNPIVGAADFRQYLQYLTSRNALNPRLTIVLGVRSSQPGLASLASDSGQIYEILRLTPAQAVAQFPAAGDWVRSIRSPQLKKLVLRPLLLAQLDSRAGSLVDEQSATRAELLERALRRLVELSGLGTRPDASGAPSEPSQWMSALMLVAWRMLTGGRGDLPVNRLAEEAREAAAAWTRHLEATGQRESAESLLSGFELLCAPESRDALLRRTVLYPSGEGAIRFIHREWQDFLTARYFAECVTRRNVDELGHVAFTVPMYVTAGELLSHQRIEAELVKEALKREGAARVYVLGNLAALIGNSTSPISGPALELILRGLGTMNVLSRVVTITGFGHRALRQAPEDSSVSDVREYLAAALRKHVLGAEAGGTDALARSLAWCHLRAFHQVSGGPPPAGPWPRLGAAPEHEHEALALICDPTQDPPDVTPRHRSLQAAFLQLLGLAQESPHRAISVVHYLYCLVVARKHRAHIAEVGQELPAVLAEGSKVAEAIKRYTVVPELWELFEHCRALFHGR